MSRTASGMAFWYKASSPQPLSAQSGLGVRHQSVHELPLARQPHGAQHHPALCRVGGQQHLVDEDHAGHGLIGFVHADALVERSHNIRPDAAGLDVAGSQVVHRVVAVPAEQHVIELRLDLAVAYSAGADILLHVRVAGAVQRKVADEPQRVHQRGILVLGLADDAPRPLEEHRTRLLVHGAAQPAHMVRLQCLVVKQQVRPVETQIIQRTVRLDLVPQLFRQPGQNIRPEPAVCISRRHIYSPLRFSYEASIPETFSLCYPFGHYFGKIFEISFVKNNLSVSPTARQLP